MWKNHLVIALRNIRKHLGISSINILGLALGIATSLFILLYVLHELSYDKHYPFAKDIYRLQASFSFGDQSFNTLAMSAGMGPTIKEELPEVKDFLRIPMDRSATLRSDFDHIYDEEDGFLLADPSIFNLFSIKMLEGDPGTALDKPLSVVLTREMARKYFGEESAVGQTLTYQGKLPFTITGIIDEAPSNSSLQYGFIASLESYTDIQRMENPDITDEQLFLNFTDVGLGAFETYFLLEKGTDAQLVLDKIEEINQSKSEESIENKQDFSITPLTDIHLGTDFGSSYTRYVFIFLGIGILILAMALVNYISLTTARAIKRAQEVGVRKVLGANRKDLVLQFFTESTLIILLGFFIGIWLLSLLIPFFSHQFDINIDGGFLLNPMVILVYLALLIICIIISGSFPAMVLSRFQPSMVLKDQLSSGRKGGMIRKGLTVFQFTTTLSLLIGSLVVAGQLRHLREEAPDYAKEQILVLPFSAEVQGSFTAYKSEIKQQLSPNGLTVASSQLFKSGVNVYFVRLEESKKNVPLNIISVDTEFLDVFNLSWDREPLEGQKLSAPEAMVLNKKAHTEIGQGEEVYKIEDINADIVGVLEDFKFQTLKWEINPLGITFTEADNSSIARNGGAFYIKLGSSALTVKDQLAALRNIHKQFEPEAAFNYYFLDDTFAEFYKTEADLGKMLIFFSILAVIISCLGILGLVNFMIERRTKELGIRKVLGASVVSILSLLSKNFILLIVIALLIASPITYYVMDKWLMDFAYRINIPWWIFVLSGAGTLFLTLLTMSFQSLRAALANPVHSLRNE